MNKTQAERAQIYFERNSKVTELTGTSDGFLFERKQDALSHSTTLENKQLETFTKGDVKAKKATEDTRGVFLKLSVKKIQKQLPEMQDVEVLKALVIEEKAQEDPRSTAIEAIEARIVELTTKP